MVYLRIKSRVLAPVNRELTLGNVAELLADASLKLNEMPVTLPGTAGIWRMDALLLAAQIAERYPQEVITILGEGVGWLHRESAPAYARRTRKNGGYVLRCIAACLVLACGGALAMAWFHADVNMRQAQDTLYAALAGEAPASALLIAVPYALGVLLGVGLYFALFNRKKVSPLTVKLREYREDIEKNAEPQG